MPSQRCPTCKEKFFDWEADRHHCGERFFVHVCDHYDVDVREGKVTSREWREIWARDAEEAAQRAWRNECEADDEGGERDEIVVVAIGGNPEIDAVDGLNVKLKAFSASAYYVKHYSANEASTEPGWFSTVNEETEGEQDASE